MTMTAIQPARRTTRKAPKQQAQPSTAAAPVTWTLTLTAPVRNAIKATAIAASTDTYRPILCGLHLSAENGRLRIVGTDSYRLHVIIAKHVDVPDGLDVTVPAKWLTSAASVRRGKRDSPLDITFDDGRATVAIDDEVRSIKLIKGGFPDTRSLMAAQREKPRADDGTFVGNFRYVADIAKVAGLFAPVPMRVRVTDGALDPAWFTLSNSDVQFDAVVMPIREA